MLQKITVVKVKQPAAWIQEFHYTTTMSPIQTWQFEGDHNMKEVAGATALILDASGTSVRSML